MCTHIKFNDIEDANSCNKKHHKKQNQSFESIQILPFCALSLDSSAYTAVAKMASRASCFKAEKKIIIKFLKCIFLQRKDTYDPF